MTKRILLVFALTLPLFGCSTVKKMVLEPMCDGIEQVTGLVDNLSFFGPAGSVAATAINWGLRTACKSVATVVAIPADLVKDMGVTGEDTPAVLAGDGQ